MKLVERMADRAATKTEDARIALVVCGMHRSGTSAIARTFSLLGATLPERLIPPNEGNPKGHWEPEKVVAYNDKMLSAAGSDLYSAVDFADDWFAAPGFGDHVAGAAEVLRQEYGDSRFIVIKDPRICLTAPVWDAALARLGYQTHYVLPLRSPSAVADSLRRRHLKTIPYDAWPRPRGELVWLRYVASAERHTRDKSRATLRFDDFLRGWKGEALRLADEFKFKWPRLAPAVENEIASFLDTQQEAPAGKPPGGVPAVAPAAMSNAELAEACYQALLQAPANAEALARVDDLIAEHRTRMARAGDIVVALEGAYPLIWQYYELHNSEARQQERAHKSVHRLWDQLTHTAKSNVSLNQELGEAGRHADQLVLALERAENDKKGFLASMEELGNALKQAGKDRESLLREKEDILHSVEQIAQDARREKADLLRSVEEIGDALKRADQINRDLTAAIEEYVKQNAALARDLAAFPVRYALRFRRLAGRIRRKLGL